MGNILNGPLFYDEKTMNMFVCGVFFFFLVGNLISSSL
jgi:hypothetical protein